MMLQVRYRANRSFLKGAMMSRSRRRKRNSGFFDHEVVESLSAAIGVVFALPSYFIARGLFNLDKLQSFFWASGIGVGVFLLGMIAGRYIMWKDSGSPTNKIKLAAWVLYAPLIGVYYAFSSNIGMAVAAASISVFCIWCYGHITGGRLPWDDRKSSSDDRLD